MDTKEKLIRVISISILVVGCSFSGSILYFFDKTLTTYLVLIALLFIAFLFTFLCLKQLFKSHEMEREVTKISYDILKKTLGDLKKKLNDENKVLIEMQSCTRFEDFARNEIYAFIRLTAILTTFFITASFAILTIIKNFSESWVEKISFVAVILSGIINIIIIWWYLKRTLFKYYNKLDDPAFQSTDIYINITKRAGKWQKFIWWLFLTCFVMFIIFIFCIVYNKLYSKPFF